MYDLTYTPKESGDFELHVWCQHPDGSGARVFLPGCPFHVSVRPGRASAASSFVRDTSALASVHAGERLLLRVQMRDDFGNNAPLINPEAELKAVLETPSGMLDLLLKSSSGLGGGGGAAPASSAALAAGEHGGSQEATAGNKRKAGGGGGEAGTVSAPNLRKTASMSSGSLAIGAYEIVSPSELALKGAHTAHILLHGQPIASSPHPFVVRPGTPYAANCRLLHPTAVGLPAPVTSTPCEVIMQLVDKYGNDVERGDVRLDAKAFGPKASECQTVDCGDGTYKITFTPSVVGDYRLQARLENVEMAPLVLHVAERAAVAQMKVGIESEQGTH